MLSKIFRNKYFHEFKLSFNNHLETVFANVNRGIAILRKLQSVLPREVLLTTYESLICPHFDYSDINRTTIHFMLSCNPTI